MSVLGFTKKNKDDVEPRCPILHPYHLLTSASTFAEIQCHLWFLRASYECWRPTDHDDGQLSPWLLTTHPICFADGAEKKAWKRVPEMHKFRCFSEFFAEKFEWQTIRMGVFCSKMDDWVDEAEEWGDVPFRCWAAILYPMRGGKMFRMFIVDPGANGEEAASGMSLRDLPDMQQKFIEYCEEKKNVALEDVRVIRNEGGKPAATSLSAVCGALYALLHNWRDWWPIKWGWLDESTFKVQLDDAERGESVGRKRRASESSGDFRNSRSKKPLPMMYFNDEERRGERERAKAKAGKRGLGK